MKLLFNILFLFLLSASVLSAQPLNRNTPEKILMAAEEATIAKNYYAALQQYEQLYSDSENSDLLIRMADLNFKLRDYASAISLYSKFYKGENVNSEPGKRLDYGRALKMVGKYSEAIKQFDLFGKGLASAQDIQFMKSEKTGALNAMDAVSDDKVSVVNIGSELNTRNSEYSPFLSSDGNLYYSSLVEEEITALDAGNIESFGTKILVSTKNGDNYDRPRTLGNNINRPGYFTSNVTVSPSGKEMIFARQLLSGGNVITESKLYRSVKGDQGWGPAQPLESINGNSQVKSPAFGELFGKEVLFFVSNKAGGYGGYDIYYSDLIGENKYTEARNLGAVINGPKDEDTPFYRNGRLYFSSNGHAGMGGYDIFSADWNAQKWSTPKNIGMPYNSSVDDLYFSLDESGTEGYLVSNRPDPSAKSLKGNTCCNDIYKVKIEEVEVNLLARTLDGASGLNLNGATVNVVPKNNDGTILTQTKNNVVGNDFAFLLSLNTNYWIIASAEGFESDTLEISTSKITATTTFERKLNLKPIVVAPPAPPEPTYVTITTEKAFVLENILYDYDDDKITTSAEQDLIVLQGLMNDYPDMVIELSSHTDSRGPASYNKKLSQRRAESARKWLMEKGIAGQRIIAKGYGFSQPKEVGDVLNNRYPFLTMGTILNDASIAKIIGDDNQEVAHQVNRRTEFKIVSGPTSIKIEEKKLVDPK